MPAAVMSIGSANLFTRNFWKAHVNPAVTPSGEGQVAKVTSLVIKVGALLGGLWILQTFPAVVFGLYVNWFRAPALLAGWAVGFFGGSWLAWSDGIKPVHTLHFGSTSASVYVGLLALVANILVAVAVNLALPMQRTRPTGRERRLEQTSVGQH